MSTIIIIVIIYCYSYYYCYYSCFSCRIPIHRVVFAGSSDYIKTAFGTNWNNNNTDNNTDNNNTGVTFTVQEDEIIAFKAILKFFYTSILPQDLMISDLLKMFRLCDVLICNHLIQKIERRLATARYDEIENNDLVCFFLLDVSIIDCTVLNKHFQKVLIIRMVNLNNMIIVGEDENQADLFFKLPLRGIVALFSYDKLLISHENEVLRLLIAWVTKHEDDSEDLSVLRDCVRVCHLDMTLINEVLQKQEWFEFSDNEKEITCAYCIHARSVQIVPKPDDIPLVWFQKREYRLSEPCSFFILEVIMSNDETSAMSNIASFRGYDIMCDIEITVSNTIKGDIIVTFPERHDEVVPVFVLVIYNVSINGVEYGPFQQLTRDTTTSIIWREEALSEEERNGVRIQVRVIEFHC